MKQSLLFVWLCTAAPLLAQTASLDPAARLLLDASHAAPARGEAAEDAWVSVYVKCNASATDWQAISDLGGQIGLCTNSLATLRIPRAQLSALSEVEGIEYIQAPKMVLPQLDLVREETKADLAYDYLYTSVEGTTTQFRGQGVIIGQVDAGIDYTHPAFRTADGTLRISRVWEQKTNPATAPIRGLHSPAGFDYGAEFDTHELILQAGADSIYGTHGTHVMGIAAGSDTYLDGKYRGVAPEAELVMVAIGDTGPNDVRVSDAIKYIFDYADQQQKPCVINLSLGSNSGPHDGTSPFDQIADAMQGPGRLIVGASGNYGGDLFHVSRQMEAQPDTLQLYLCHAFYSDYVYGDVELWADPQLDLSFEMIDRSSFNGALDVVANFSMAELMDGQVHTYTLGRNITGSILLSAEINPLNGKQHMLLRSYLTGQRNNHQVAIRIVKTQGSGQLDVWADDAKISLATRDKNGVINLPEGFCNPAGESTIVEIGGTANRILSVGAYTTRDKYQLEGSADLLDVNYPVQTYPVNWVAPINRDELCIFSSFGPTADGRQKPELCAPGSFIISAMSGYDVLKQYLATHYTAANGHPVNYGYLQGTSMSCPVVTGAVALWLQAYPNITPEQLKEAVALTSRQDDYTANDGPRYWGAGKLDVMAGLLHFIELSQSQGIHEIEASPAESSVLYDLSGRRLRQAPSKGLYVAGSGKEARKIFVR